MRNRELEADRVYGAFGQRLARFLHLNKARYRAKERGRVAWLARFIPPHGVVFDIGAHFGYFAKEFARLHGGTCTVYAFEPLSYSYDILKKVTAGFHNVHPTNLALSDRRGSDELLVPVKSQGKIGPGLAHLGQEQNRDYVRESIRTERLDDFVGDAGIDRLDFIKCDVEGAELLAFSGGVNTLRRFRPATYMEVNAGYTRRLGYEPGRLFEFFHGIGYAPHLVEQEGSRFSLRPVEGYETPGDYLLTV